AGDFGEEGTSFRPSPGYRPPRQASEGPRKTKEDEPSPRGAAGAWGAGAARTPDVSSPGHTSIPILQPRQPADRCGDSLLRAKGSRTDCKSVLLPQPPPRANRP